MTKFIVFLLACIATCSAFKLPSYINKCKFNDDNMGQCIMDNIPVIKPHLKDGIKELAIPPLAPFHVQEILIDASQNLKIKMTDLDVLHLDEFEIKNIKLNAETFDGEMEFHFDQIQILGTYDIDGQILVLPIKGHGPANITLYQFNVLFNYRFQPIERKGKMFVNISDQRYTFKSGKITLHLDNLFNGDKTLGDQVNNFLNENWQDVEGLLRPAVTETVTTLVGAIFDKIAKSVPLDELFLLD
ncbi:protein takeout-like [Atheta coriaria]|uniref:protein takeout-like n=1 Tax=Dalotia coriaria TaxID=877792 RepID=UPI0031F35DE7